MSEPAEGQYRGFTTIGGHLYEVLPEEGTPAIFINGEWVELEELIDKLGGKK